VLHEALRDGVANHIVTVSPDGRYGFRHALLREVVADDLLPGERSALDLALASALEARAERDGMSVYLAAGIAHHYTAAGDQPAALRANVRAADAAERVHAYGQAAALLERRSSSSTVCTTPRSWPAPTASRSCSAPPPPTSSTATPPVKRRWRAPGSP
jgi:predicted ATPase